VPSPASEVLRSADQQYGIIFHLLCVTTTSHSTRSATAEAVGLSLAMDIHRRHCGVSAVPLLPAQYTNAVYFFSMTTNFKDVLHKP